MLMSTESDSLPLEMSSFNPTRRKQRAPNPKRSLLVGPGSSPGTSISALLRTRVTAASPAQGPSPT